MPPKGFRSRRGRLTAALTGKAKEVGPEEAHARNVMAITKRIHQRDTKVRAMMRDVQALRLANRRDRRELRAVLQRNAPDIDVDQQVRQEEDRIEDGQARWAETGSTRRH